MRFVFVFSILALLVSERVFADQGDKTPAKASKITDPGNKSDEGQTSDESDSVTVSSSAVSVSGDKAQFMSHHGISKDFSGGVEDFYMEKEPDKDTTIKLEGHGLFDVHDYKLKLGMDKKDIGHWDIGYTAFRTWYDGDGGFFPQNGQWFSLYDNDLHVDRGHAWFGGELTLPDLPVFGFKFDDETRTGMKDSLLWGFSNLTGGFGTRSLVPSFRTLDERRDSFDGYIRDTIDETSFKTGLQYETTANRDSLNIRLNPYEATDRSVTQVDKQSSDLFNFYGSTETWFSEKTLFTTAYSLSTESTQIGGNEVYGQGYGAPLSLTFANLQAGDNAYIDLVGGSQAKKKVVSFNLMTMPWDDWALTLGVRPVHERVDGMSQYLQTNATDPNGAVDNFTTVGEDHTEFLNVTEKFEARYKGIKDWAFYARGDWEEGNGTITKEIRAPDYAVFGNSIVYHYDGVQERFNQKYTLGSNWYPSRHLNFGGQYYHLIHATSYITRNKVDAGGFLYPGQIANQSWTTDDFNSRATWRPLGNVTAISRYDYQETRFDSLMRVDPTISTALASQESGRNNQHIFGETVTWNPFPQLYFQGSADYSINRTKTPVNGFMGAVVESRNDYLTTSLASGYVLNDKTDLQLQYTYYFAPDYFNNATSGMVYGSGAEDHSVTLGMVRRITKEIQWTVKYGFFSHRDQLYGGHEDYAAHLVYTGLNMKF